MQILKALNATISFLLELAMLAALALAAAAQTGLAVVFMVVALANQLLAYLWKQ